MICEHDLLYYNLKGCSEREWMCYDLCNVLWLVLCWVFTFTCRTLMNFNRRRINVSIHNPILECRSGTERTLLTYLLPEKVTMLSTFITLPHLLCCSMKHIFCRSNYLLINNLFIYTFYPSIFSLCGHFYFGCSKCSIPWCRNYWHLAPTFNIFSFVLLFDAAYSSHCSIFFVSSRSSTTCVCRDATTTLFLSFFTIA